jgi:hypothetical protein
MRGCPGHQDRREGIIVAEHPNALWQLFPDGVAAIQALRPGQASSSAGDRVGRVIKILEEHFARGEIPTRELEEGRAFLRGGSA